jgi:hypothetical protein
MLRRQTNNWSRKQREIERVANELPRDAYTVFKKETPVRTGNARNNTNYQSTQKGGTITGNYPYANELNKGKSRQAPDGMTTPTIDYIRDTVRRALR